jgi:hypothetical protein
MACACSFSKEPRTLQLGRIIFLVGTLLVVADGESAGSSRFPVRAYRLALAP